MTGLWDTLTRKLWDWYKHHDGDIDAHHTKYTDADVITHLESLKVYFDGGNVGIGTPSPREVLEIYGVGVVRLAINSGGNNSGFRLLESGAAKYSVGSYGGGNFVIWDEVNNVSVFYIKNKNIGVGTQAPTTKLDINSDKIRLRTSKTPSSATDTGNQGDICWDADYVYVCTATNTWKRASLSTW